MLYLMKNIWKQWKRFAALLIKLQNGLFLGLVFIFGIGPAALLAKITRRKHLDLTWVPEPSPDTYWQPTDPTPPGMDQAQRPH